ncbi:MAG: hypothetical protein AAFX99_16655, partial [Myxococcota bacterium]
MDSTSFIRQPMSKHLSISTPPLLLLLSVLCCMWHGCGDTDDSTDDALDGSGVITADGAGSSWNNTRLAEDLHVPDDELDVEKTEDLTLEGRAAAAVINIELVIGNVE